MVQRQRNGFKQITQEEREEIAHLVREGKSVRAIGRELHRHHTTISREIERNGTDCGW
jgi:transposase, IS30 family